MRVLMVEDDDAIAVPLARGLEREGLEVARASTGAAALLAQDYDVVLLDLGLPDIDGFEVCRRLRAISEVPIIVVTARGDEVDRVVGLELGADDYIVKPFGFRELLARIRAVTRRAQARPEELASHVVGELTIDRRTHQVTLGERTVALTPKEFDLLALLAEDPGTVFTRAHILEEVWDAHWYGPTKTLDVHVAAVRKKLGDPAWIETVRGVGFRLVEPPSATAGAVAEPHAPTATAQLRVHRGLRAARARDPARLRVRAIRTAPADQRSAARRARAFDPRRGRARERRRHAHDRDGAPVPKRHWWPRRRGRPERFADRRFGLRPVRAAS